MSSSDSGASGDAPGPRACPYSNPNEGTANLCTGDIEYANYNYNPHMWACAVFVALFGLTTALHLIQSIKSRIRWYLIFTLFLAGITEVLGWSARLWTTVSLEWLPDQGGYWYTNPTSFLMQISTLIFAPVFLTAFWYIFLGQLIKLLGPQYCRFSIKAYAITFICGDVTSLVIQAVGGGIASSAPDLAGANRGAHIMVAGVIIQMVVMTLYSLLLLEFVVRYFKAKPVAPLRFRKTREVEPVPTGTVSKGAEKKAKILIGAMVFSTILIYVRSIYRTVELLDGWTGPIISDETLFCVLDGLMVFLAIAIFNVIHPDYFWPREDEIQHAYSDEKHLSHSPARSVEV